MKSELVRDLPAVYEKLWGREIWIANSEKYCGKILVLSPGQGFSVHLHVKKTESFYVLDDGLVLNGINKDTAAPYQIILSKGDVIHIDPGYVHQLWNTSDKEVSVVEVSTQHFEEDSYRTTRKKIL
jgi:oxalate decarboxylase/phosphoglucose isomerase-like protein (cupin superfamily)